MTDLWLRNPALYIRECIEVGARHFVWDNGYLHKRSIDVDRFMQAYFPTMPYNMLLIGNRQQGVVEVDQAHTVAKPLREHVLWTYGDPWAILEQSVEEPEYEGQMVVVTGIPNVSLGPGKRFMRLLTELQQENPQTPIHVHALYSYRMLFGLTFASVDVDPRIDAKKGNVILPNGKRISIEQAIDYVHWINLLEFIPPDLKIPRNRCMYNIKSAQWAARHYKENIRFSYRANKGPVDAESKFATPPVNRSTMVRRVEAQEGDKFLCDTCSLQTTCKYFRTGAVCAVPDSEPAELARFFKTRDSDTIIEGLGTLLAANARRLERGMQEELIEGGLSPEVTKIINSLYDRGEKLAKLVNPALRAAPAQINVNKGIQVAMQSGTPQALMAEVVAMFEAKGIPRHMITPEMIEEVLGNPEEIRQRAIDVASVPYGS